MLYICDMTCNGEILRAIPFGYLTAVLSPELGVFMRIIAFVTFRELVHLDTTFDIKGLSCIKLIPEDYFNQWCYRYSGQLSWLIRRRARITVLRTLFYGPWERNWIIDEHHKMQQNMREMFPILQSLEIGNLAAQPVFNIPEIYDDHITQLAMSSCRHVSIKTLKLTNGLHLSDDGIIHLKKVFPNLEHLSMPRCKIGTYGLPGLRGYTNLRILDLMLCPTLNDAGMLHLNQCLSLEDLNIDGCHMVTDLGINSLVEGSPKRFRRLLFFCEKVTNVGIVEVASQCRQLQHICATSKITDVGLKALADYCTDLRSAKFHTLPDKNWKVSEEGLTALTTGCVRLESIRINGSNITYAGGLVNLNSITLEICSKLTDEGLLCLAKRSPNLRELDLGGCLLITDAGFLRFTCPCLLYIDVSFSLITDAGIQSLVTGSPCLQDVLLSDCDGISDVGVECIVSGCPDIRMIHLWDCPHVSKPWKRIFRWTTGRPLV